MSTALQCPACSGTITEGNRFCPACGAALDASATRTATGHPPPGPSGSWSPGSAAVHLSAVPPSQGRFVPGQVLLERYRIVGLVGKGGMGEVYRADDLKLAQPVALKFLPEELQQDPDRLDRLFSEVRMARQVSHPAVCRVYDVGEVDGQPFFSMEYVDGENLASLLRRIGRLPPDKALEIARQVCAGVAAAHEKGVLHRDLKPDNVMLDGRGKARLTDFGLAALQQSGPGADVRSGTPAYMSPEQFAGREVTVRSEVYALGLLLYELFTGRRAFLGKTVSELSRQHREDLPESPSALVEGLDPAVENAILCCLEKDPRRRPPSALAVAAALPGGDPLAAALAAGETPSPELVAAAGRHEAVHPAWAWACVAAAAVGLVATGLLIEPRNLRSLVPVTRSPAVLEDRGRELVRKLGNGEAPADQGVGFAVDSEYFRWAAEPDPSPTRWEGLRTGAPPVLLFWYRQSPRPLASTSTSGRVSWSNPLATFSGMAGVRLDMTGRLVAFYQVTPQVEDGKETGAEPDWRPLFAEAGLDPDRFRPVEPKWTPPFFVDRRAAWEGVFPERPAIPLRVEAAAYRGRPVHFQLVSPWTRAERMQRFPFRTGELVAQTMGTFIFLGLLVAGGLLARHNLRKGRGDRRGAFRLAAFTLATASAAWLFSAHHVREQDPELGLAARGLGGSLLMAFSLWLFYLAVEPYMRRLWPRTLISWTRLLSGALRDPIVGRDALVGTAWGALLASVLALVFRLPAWLGGAASVPWDGNLDRLLGLGDNLGVALGVQLGATATALGLLLALLLLRLLLRSERRAAVAMVLVMGVLWSLRTSEVVWWLALPLGFVIMGSLAVALLRFGVLTCVVGLYVTDLTLSTPISFAFGRWDAAPTVFTTLVVAALAFYGFHVSRGGGSPFGGEAPLSEPGL